MFEGFIKVLGVAAVGHYSIAYETLSIVGDVLEVDIEHFEDRLGVLPTAYCAEEFA